MTTEESPQQPSFTPVTIQPRIVYGLRSEVVGNVQFSSRSEVIYPVEGVLAFHDYVLGKQKFLRLPENVVPLILAISRTRRQLAVLEQNNHPDKKIQQYISIYDTITLKKRKHLELPSGNEGRRINVMAFSQDSKALFVLTNFPEEQLILFLFDKSSSVIQGRAANPNQRGLVNCIASNPEDQLQVAVGGNLVFKLMARAEKGFTMSGNVKTEGLTICSMAWLSVQYLLAGTSTGSLLLIENGEVKMEYDGRTIEMLDLNKEAELEDNNPEKAISDGTVKPNKSKDVPNKVLCLMSFPKGFAYAVHNEVYVFEKESKFKFERKTVLHIPYDIYPEPSYQIMNMAVNLNQDTVVVTAKHNQIYVGILIVPESLKTKFLEFKPLGEYIHIDEIIDMSVCAWKPIIMTASKDQTIRIWNYESGKIELVKKFQVEVSVVELNPTGLLAAVAFADQLRLMSIFINDLNIYKTYDFPRCRDVKFSTFGHLMAAAYNNLIAITSVFNLEVLLMLKGHNGDVMSVAWSKNDKLLVSGGNEGAIYAWCMDTGERVHEVVQKGIEYRSLVCSGHPTSIYAVTGQGTFREILGSEIVRDLTTPDGAQLLSITLSRSDLVLYMSSNEGHLYNIQLPFLDTGGGTIFNYRFFDSAITKVLISHDGTLLFTASKRGTLAIWNLRNIENRVARMDPELLKCEDILIPREVLKVKFEAISLLENRLKQQAAEFTYQLSQNEAFDEQQMADIHKGYCKAIEELKALNNELEQKHVEELNQTFAQINEMKAEQKQAMSNLSEQYSERMLMEYQKFSTLRENMMQMREGYEDKLRKSSVCLQDTIEALETDFKNQLRDRQELIRKLMQEMGDKKIEFVEYCNQVEMDNDRNRMETQLQYEQKLKTEKDATSKWREEAGVFKKKFYDTQKEADDLREEVDILKVEHFSNEHLIENLNRQADDLKKEIEEREYAITDKEKRIIELNRKNQELEKYKLVLNHKITELKSEIEPRERQIKEKRNQIAEMEKELEGLHTNNLTLELQLSELKGKYLSSITELEQERERAKLARAHSQRIASDIYSVAGSINDYELLRKGMKMLFQKYAGDAELKKTLVMEEAVVNEFQRQRDHLELTASRCKERLANKNDANKAQKLMNENIVLLKEMEILQKQKSEAIANISRLEMIIGLGGKNLTNPQLRERLRKAFDNVDNIQANFEDKFKEMNRTIEQLKKENEALRSKDKSKK